MKSKSKQILGFATLLVGLTVCGVGAWLLLSPAQNQAAVRLQLNDPDANNPNVYNPYFIQIEFEIIQSQIVLGKVVDALDLNEEWGKRYNGGRVLETNETIKMLQRRIKFVCDQNLNAFEIRVTTENADEAAKIANTIAEAYRDYRIRQHQQNTVEDINAMEETSQMEDKKITREQSSLEGMQKQLNFTIEPIDGVLRSNYPAYFQAKQELTKEKNFQELLKSKIKSLKSYVNQPIDSSVSIVSPAVPPKSPTGPNRALGMILSLCGLAISVFGISILKKS